MTIWVATALLPSKGKPESVSEGHPDKLRDQVFEAVLDACLAEGPHSMVACEIATKNNMLMIAGEIIAKAKLDYQKVARCVVDKFGFDSYVDDRTSVDSKGISDKILQVCNDVRARAKRAQERKFTTDEVNAWISMVMKRRRAVRKSSFTKHGRQMVGILRSTQGAQIMQTMLKNQDKLTKPEQLEPPRTI